MLENTALHKQDTQQPKTAKSLQKKVSQFRTYFIPFCIGLIGIIVSILISFNTKKLQDEKIQQRILASNKLQISYIEREVKTDLLVLDLLKAYFDGSEYVSRSEFSIFTQLALKHHIHIQALEWVPKVSKKQRASYEAKAKSEGFKHFTIIEHSEDGKIIPAPQRNVYFPAYYLEPMDGNENAFGYNLASNPRGLEALQKSATNGKPVASAPIELVQGNGSQIGLLVFNPVYDNTNSIDTLSLKGFVVTVIRVKDFVGETIKGNTINTSLFIEDITNPSIPEPIFGVLPPKEVRPDFTTTSHLYVAGRTWKIQAYPSSNIIETPFFWSPWIVLFSGLAFTFFIVFIVAQLIRRQDVIQRTVEERTKEIQKAQKHILLKQKDQEAFASTAAHDLKAPLRRISVFSNIITKQLDDGELDDAKAKLKNIEQIATSGTELVNDLLHYSKIETTDLQLVEVDLNKLITSIIQYTATELSAVNGSIKTQNLPTLQGDKSSLSQLFNNIIANAIKYCREDIPLVINVEVQAKGEHHFHFSIADNGIGIPEDLLNDVFIPFRRMNKKKDGSGIGLAICKGVVERHHGKIWVESKVESGSTFHFILPQNPQTHQKIDNTVTKKSSTLNPINTTSSNAQVTSKSLLNKSTTSSGTPLRVILLENEHLDVELFKIHLKKVDQNISLEVFMSSDEFLASNMLADVIFLDYDLKEGRTGLDLVKIIRAKDINYTGKVILASGQIDAKLEKAFLDEGGNGVLEKADMTDESLKQLLIR